MIKPSVVFWMALTSIAVGSTAAFMFIEPPVLKLIFGPVASVLLFALGLDIARSRRGAR